MLCDRKGVSTGEGGLRNTPHHFATSPLHQFISHSHSQFHSTKEKTGLPRRRPHHNLSNMNYEFKLSINSLNSFQYVNIYLDYKYL